MAHFAKLDENNIVLEVLVVSNETLNNVDYPDSESLGVEFLTNLTGYSNWKQTSYNASFRKNYAGIGDTYDQILDAFIAPKPFPSWVLNEQLCRWEAPIPYPQDDKLHIWNEQQQQWMQI